MESFTRMNTDYKARFGFPFILAIRNATKRTILGAYASRLGNPPGAELANALAQVRWLEMVVWG
jgi:2-oxo-4-hydroxy-4-carboxy-5-ureidoimidazoline decarboxylase|eukprot:SAG25_NODE_3125_length_1207_cov_1.259928_3_plen_64_part_00